MPSLNGLSIAAATRKLEREASRSRSSTPTATKCPSSDSSNGHLGRGRGFPSSARSMRCTRTGVTRPRWRRKRRRRRRSKRRRSSSLLVRSHGSRRCHLVTASVRSEPVEGFAACVPEPWARPSECAATFHRGLRPEPVEGHSHSQSSSGQLALDLSRNDASRQLCPWSGASPEP